MNIELRFEKPFDYAETENLTREAFWNQYGPGCVEHYLLHIMRDCPAFIPELDIVAVCNDKIVGNIIYTKAHINGDNGNNYEVLCLGPISVLPEYQNSGIGKQMIEYTKNLAHEMRFRAILLCGDPDYYGKHGFVPAEEFGIRTADNMYLPALQVCELYDGALSDTKGRYFEDSIFNIDEALAAEFDKEFPAKEKLTGTPSQKRFEVLVGMMRSAN